ncbi:hypothetical protein D3C87_618490 [compost metagenome]
MTIEIFLKRCVYEVGVACVGKCNFISDDLSLCLSMIRLSLFIRPMVKGRLILPKWGGLFLKFRLVAVPTFSCLSHLKGCFRSF